MCHYVRRACHAASRDALRTTCSGACANCVTAGHSARAHEHAAAFGWRCRAHGASVGLPPPSPVAPARPLEGQLGLPRLLLAGPRFFPSRAWLAVRLGCEVNATEAV